MLAGRVSDVSSGSSTKRVRTLPGSGRSTLLMSPPRPSTPMPPINPHPLQSPSSARVLGNHYILLPSSSSSSNSNNQWHTQRLQTPNRCSQPSITRSLAADRKRTSSCPPPSIWSTALFPTFSRTSPLLTPTPSHRHYHQPLLGAILGTPWPLTPQIIRARRRLNTTIPHRWQWRYRYTISTSSVTS